MHAISEFAGVIDEWFVDAGLSGKTDPMTRPRFADLVAEIEDLEGEVRVIASERSRYGRTSRALDDARLALLQDNDHVRMLDASGTEHTLSDTNPEEWLLDEIKTIFTEYERRTIVRRLANGKARARKQGRHVGGKPPFGFEVVDGVLTPKNGEYQTAQKIVAMFPTHTIRQIAVILGITKHKVETVSANRDRYREAL